MSIKIEREIISPRKNSSYILSNSKSDILHRANIIINNSSSKAMYSFPLSKRFKKDIDDNSTFFYNKPSTLNQRKAFIGYGNRSTILYQKVVKQIIIIIFHLQLMLMQILVVQNILLVIVGQYVESQNV